MVYRLPAYQILLGMCSFFLSTKECVPSYTPDFPGFNIDTTVESTPAVTIPTTTTSSSSTPTTSSSSTSTTSSSSTSTTSSSSTSTTTTSGTTTSSSTTSTTSSTTTTTTLSLICPTGWTLFQSNCFIFINTPTANQADAVAACTAMGATFPIIQDAATNSFVSNGMRLPGCTLGTVPNPGLTDAQYATCFQHSDGSAFNYYPWMQPCNGYLQEPDELVAEDCVVMNVCGSIYNQQVGSWNDLQCSSPAFVPVFPAYVCEMPAT